MIIDTEDPKRGLTDYEHRLIDEVSRKSRQLAEARRLLRDALFALPAEEYMTDRERAEEFIDRVAFVYGGPPIDPITGALERLLSSRYEEGREQGRREEREECARIVDAARPCPVTDIEQAVADDALRPVAAAIRARSGRGEEKKNCHGSHRPDSTGKRCADCGLGFNGESVCEGCGQATCGCPA